MTPDSERREARRFEPPPWEKQRFEELEKRQREEPERPAAEDEPATRGGEESEPRPPAVQEGAATEEVPAADSSPAAPAAPAAPAELDAMLLALKSEEPDALEGAWKLGVAAAVFVTTVGLMLVVWGSVAMARAASAGAAGVMGSAIMSVMGALFSALGVWLGVRSLRQRGVL